MPGNLTKQRVPTHLELDWDSAIWRLRDPYLSDIGLKCLPMAERWFVMILAVQAYPIA
jgi:hypothetical protein